MCLDNWSAQQKISALALDFKTSDWKALALGFVVLISAINSVSKSSVNFLSKNFNYIIVCLAGKGFC